MFSSMKMYFCFDQFLQVYNGSFEIHSFVPFMLPIWLYRSLQPDKIGSAKTSEAVYLQDNFLDEERYRICLGKYLIS
jgi:hypothetical protein